MKTGRLEQRSSTDFGGKTKRGGTRAKKAQKERFGAGGRTAGNMRKLIKHPPGGKPGGGGRRGC